MPDVNNYYINKYEQTGASTVVWDHAAAADFEYTGWYGPQQLNYLWSGRYFALGGDDVIIRDRPGPYRASGVGSMNGGEGNDTISYAHYTGAIDIDLSTPEGYGVAQAKGLSGQEIFGVDRLISIENAIGTNGDDEIEGSGSVNVLSGGNGEDEIRAGGGNDTIYGGNQGDRINGNNGNDSIEGGAGADVVHGDNNNDIVMGESGNDILFGDSGNDNLYGGTGFNVLWGGTGNDIMLIEGSGRADGEEGNDIVVGGLADDELSGGIENDILNGLAGRDTIYGDEGYDTIDGGAGNDRLYGGTGLDQMQGGGGNDILVGGANSDQLHGGSGTDTAVWEGSVRVEINVGIMGKGTAEQSGFTDSLQGIENFRTGSGTDHIYLGGADNFVDSGASWDWVDTGNGKDAVLAGDGDDVVGGGGGNDVVQGGDGDDRLYGQQGVDTLAGNDGKDRFIGGDGADFLFGGNDADGFIFRSGDMGVDLIQDFELGEDWIGLANFLAEPPQIGQSYASEVYAMSVDNGQASLLVGMTDDGWQAFAKLAGYSNVGAVNAAIADGSLFHPTPLNNETPGGFDF